MPFEDSLQLLKNSGLPDSALIEVGTEHRLADKESLEAMLKAAETAASQQAALGDWKYIRVTIVHDIPVVCFNDLALAMDNGERGVGYPGDGIHVGGYVSSLFSLYCTGGFEIGAPARD